MTTSSSDAKPASFDAADYLRRITIERASPYDLWTQSTGLPVHEGYFIEDVRAIDLGWWEERQCYAAFLKLAGQEGITEARVSEIPPGRTLPPMKFALDEIVYVIEGSGLTTVSVENKDPKKTFEWTKHSLFMIPRNITFEMTNAQGTRPARLLHYNYLPVSMSLMPDPSGYFNGGNLPVLGQVVEGDTGLYGAAQRVERPNRPDGRPGMAFWIGNFFPDMKAWDKLVAFRGRGAGGHAVWVRYPGATMTNHMSVFPSRTYKKAHRHGPASSSSFLTARASPSCGPRARRRLSSRGTRGASSYRRTVGSTSTSMSARIPRATSPSTGRRASAATATASASPIPAIRSSTPTRSLGYTRSSRRSSPAVASPP